MKTLVSGGRDFADKKFVFEHLDRIHHEYAITTIIHGGATGVDSWAKLWATENLIPEWMFPARWAIDGRKLAGPRRNQRMLDVGQPDIVIIFPGNNGTEDMTKRATTYLRGDNDVRLAIITREKVTWL